MRSEKEVLERFKEYGKVYHIYDERGCVAWRTGTGDNIELIYIESSEKGNGAKLFKDFLSRIKPYHSVYVFHLASNPAGAFYEKMGLKNKVSSGIYRNDDTILRWETYDNLRKAD